MLIRIDGQTIDVDRTLLEISKAECRDSLAEFVRQAWHVTDPAIDYVHGWHVDAMCLHLEAITDGVEIDGQPYNRLLINVPPGTMKSRLLNVFWPAWEWGPAGMPEQSYLCAAHKIENLSERDSQAMRMLVQSEWYQARWGDTVQLDPSNNSKLKFANLRGGFRIASAMSSLTGIRASRVLIDDPHSVDSALSEATRGSEVQTFLEAVPTRVISPKRSAIVVIMQRLHEDDVSGVILSRNMGYDHLMLPMYYDPQRAAPTMLDYHDPRTSDGEPLFPARYPPEVLAQLEASLGPYAVAGQLQQQPTPRGGGIIKRAWWQPWEPAKYPVMSLVVASLDPAYTEKQENDYSALTVWGVFGSQDDIRGVQYYDTHGNPVMIPPDKGPGSVEARPRVILMSAWAERLELHNLVNKVAETCKRFGVDRLLIEAKASGHSVAQELNRIYAAEPWAVHMVNPGRVDKTARAHSVVPLFTDELVHVPMVRDGDGWKANRDWAEKVIAECEVFPKGKHDDRVDSVVQALRHLREIGALTRTEETSSAIDEAMAHSGPALPALYPV